MKPIYILGTNGKVENPEKFTIEELLKIVGLNTGNLMFQYAVAKLIEGPKTFIGLTGIPYNDASGCRDGSYLVFPAANHLRTGADWSGLCGFLENSKVPLIVLGLGAQADSTSDPKATAEALKADVSAMRLVNVLRDKAAWITVRGDFTAEVCRLLDMKEVDVLGCPSLMLNPHMDAGKRIASKLEQTKKKENPRIAFTAAGPWDIKGSHKEDLERRFFQLIRKHSGLYVQQSGGEAALAFAMIKFDKLPLSSILSFRQILDPDISLDELVAFARNKARIYFNAEKWIAAMETIDLCFGTRLHGNMAAIAAGTPGFVSSHDSRTDELAMQMKLPYQIIKEPIPDTNLNNYIQRFIFDWKTFDDNRDLSRKIYTQKFCSIFK